MSNFGPQYGPPQGPPMGMPGPGPAAPPKKKGLSTGCMIVLGIMLFFLLTGGGIAAYVVYKISTDKDVQKVMGALGDVAQLAAEAQQAPGTNELRALGCEQAMALDAAKMQKIGESFMDGGAPPPPEAGRMVMCQMTTYAAPPSCDDAAKAYVKGAAPTSKFMLTVTARDTTKNCSGVYSPSGVLERPIGGGSKL